MFGEIISGALGYAGTQDTNAANEAIATARNEFESEEAAKARDFSANEALQARRFGSIEARS